MKIGELARHVGLPIDTVRYYERHGVLPPPARRASGYRDYGPDDVSRLCFVLRAKRLGFTLTEIRELLELTDATRGDTGNVKAAAQAKLEQVEQRIEEMQRIRDALRGMVDACPGSGPITECPIRAALLRDL